MKVRYESLSRNSRRDAQKLAKKLLRSTPPAASDQKGEDSVRWMLSTAFIKPKNVLAAFTYGDGEGNWWGDVVLRKGRGTIQLGIAESHPCRSQQEALAFLKKQIGDIKATTEHPVVNDFRANGMDPELFELLRVHHKNIGYRYIMRSYEEIAMESQLFGEKYALRDSANEFDVENAVIHAGKMIYVARHASGIILQYAAKASCDAPFLLPPGETDTEVNKVREAASFLLRQGILNIDERDTWTITGPHDRYARCRRLKGFHVPIPSGRQIELHSG